MKIGSLILLLFIGLASLAQTDEQFDALGRQIFKEFTDTSYHIESEYIRISNYEKLIDRQDLSLNQKARTKNEINSTYEQLYAQYWLAYKELKENYIEEVKDGATFEYLDTRFEPMQGTKDAYHLKTRFIYRNGKVRTMVSFEYDTAWFYEFFQIMSPIKEDF